MRGGARPGSGRKPGPEQKVTISFRVTPKTHRAIREFRDRGIDINAELERMIARLAGESREDI